MKLLPGRISSFISSPLIRASCLLFSTIVGAGVLGIPFVVARVGLAVGTAYILGMGLVMLAVHTLIGEIIVRTGKHLQITGLVRTYIGPVGAWIMAIIFMVLHMGALVAYLIGQGQSLSALFGGPQYVWAAGFFVIGTIIISRGTKLITKFDAVMNIVTVAVLAIIVGINLSHIQTVPLAPDYWSSLLLPYGVLLFAFHGTSAIPEMHIITGRNPRLLRRAILIGSAAPLALYLVFTLTTVIVTGRDTTQIATIGLGRAIGPFMMVAGNLFAVLAIATSFVTIGQALRRTFQWDFGVKPALALLLAVGIPALIYIVGAREFVKVIAVIGGVCGTIEIFLLVLAYRRAIKHRAR